MWRVIAADDEGYIREALQKLMDWKKMGCILEAVVSDGQALIDRIRQESPDIVITDIQMPGLDGMEVCRFVYETCLKTQVILLTAHSEFTYARAAIKYDACAYVLKVSIMDELPGAVEKAVKELERLRREAVQEEQKERKEPGTLYLQMEQYIEQNFQSKFSLEDIAEALHANGSYLSRLYKTKTGKYLFDAILDRRIDAAKDYLLRTDMKVYEISEAVGIEDSGYFSKMFKKKIGVLPKEFRKRGNHGEM